MRRKLLISTLIVVLLFTIAPFSGVLAKNVSNNPHKSVNFSAPATILQVPGTANTVPLGGNYYKTTGEIMTGSLGTCTAWPAISGASIYMENTTYFTLDANYNISGIDYATITFTVQGDTFKIYAAGTVDGNYLSSADTTLYWTEVSSSGSLKNTYACGKIDATFVWMSDTPGATGTFSGTVIK